MCKRGKMRKLEIEGCKLRESGKRSKLKRREERSQHLNIREEREWMEAMASGVDGSIVRN